MGMYQEHAIILYPTTAITPIILRAWGRRPTRVPGPLLKPIPRA